jgi:dipeptidyl aminopeptidase/acylaminoacyl peptidase
MNGNLRGALLCLLLVTACGPAEEFVVHLDHPATSDPALVDAEYPPAMRELSFRSAGSKLNGLMYIADGAGPHPTVVLLHGYAGNERNLDLAQAIRRAGINVMYFNYRGSWGSGGEFSPSNAIEDVATAIAFVRSDDAREAYRGDGRVALIGHSFGGFTGAMATLADPDVACFASIAGANVGALGKAAADPEARAAIAAGLGRDMDYEGGPIKADPDAVTQDMVSRAEDFDLTMRAPSLVGRPLLLVAGARDETAPKVEHHDPLMAALQAAGGTGVTELVLDDDHYFSAHRVELSVRVVDWLRTACWPGM